MLQSEREMIPHVPVEGVSSGKGRVVVTKRVVPAKPPKEVRVIHVSAVVDGARDLRKAAQAAVGAHQPEEAIAEILPLEKQYLAYAHDGVETQRFELVHFDDYIRNLRPVIEFAYKQRHRLRYADPQAILAIAEQHPQLDRKFAMPRVVLVSPRKMKLDRGLVCSAVCWVDSSQEVLVREAGHGWAKAWFAFRIR